MAAKKAAPLKKRPKNKGVEVIPWEGTGRTPTEKASEPEVIATDGESKTTFKVLTPPKLYKRPKLTAEAVLKFFPFPKVRDIQKYALEELVKFYNAGAKYVFVEAPVGTGKSGIAVAFARAIEAAGGNTFMVTLTEHLQDQYMRDFAEHGLKALKGRGKYRCDKAGGSCAVGRTLKLKCNDCPYQTAKVQAFAAPHMVCNYHSFLANTGGPGYTRAMEAFEANSTPEDGPAARDVAIWDEAHTMEAFLLEQMGLDVDLSKLGIAIASPLPDTQSDPTPYFDLLKGQILPAVEKELKATVDPNERERLELFQLAALSALSRRETDDWVPERPELRGGQLDPSRFIMKPLKVAAYGPQLHGWADFNIFMSGTILSAWQMVMNLGLDADAGEHIVVPSPFPAKNRPIFATRLDMTFKSRDESWPIAFKLIDRLMTLHAKDKGMLLVPSNAMLDAIKKGLSPANAVRIITASGDTRLKKYQEHIDSRSPTVLAAPGMWEGADLKGDASRFQIIPAIPRAFFKGQIAARAKVDKQWYRWLNYTKFLQGTGRSIRDENDFAATYVLDQDLLIEAERDDSLIPAWCREAIIDGLPKLPEVAKPGRVR